MENLYDIFGTDANLEVTGIPVQIGPAVFTIARAGGKNTSFSRKMKAALKPYRGAYDSMPQETQEAVLREVYAKTIVLDWENVTNPQGEDVPFSVENAIQLFEDLPDLFRQIQKVADTWEAFREDELEDDAGN